MGLPSLDCCRCKLWHVGAVHGHIGSDGVASLYGLEVFPVVMVLTTLLVWSWWAVREDKLCHMYLSLCNGLPWFAVGRVMVLFDIVFIGLYMRMPAVGAGVRSFLSLYGVLVFPVSGAVMGPWGLWPLSFVIRICMLWFFIIGFY